MTLRFHLDESVSNAVAVGLRLRGFDVTLSKDAGLLGASDEDQLAYASSMNRLLVTHDDDFLRLHSVGIVHAGIAYARPNQRTIGQLVLKLVALGRAKAGEEIAGTVKFL
jgi:uncharacterized protein with PIN domain